ncbi:hypothetical protein QBG47_000775 [Salmonella enterica]|nr:hypothetical protein [Salmonella enterica]
MHNKLNPYREG